MSKELTEYLDKLEELASEATPLDCGDNSCHFAKDKGGMRTNGGCRCFNNAGFGRSAVAAAYEMLPMYLAQRSAIPKLIEIIRVQNEALEWYATPGIHERWRAEEALSRVEKIVSEK